MSDFLLGVDIGSSSIKVNLLNAQNGQSVASSTNPEKEMSILAKKQGWAEQNPEDWWKYIKEGILKIGQSKPFELKNTRAIGITYQMHGLVALDNKNNLLRPSIIWCDSRAVDYGEKAFKDLGKEKCLKHLLNSPGNFTASKLAWIKNNEPDIFKKIDKFMLPGDYISYKFTGNINTTISGLSEGILWDFLEDKSSDFLLNYYGINHTLIPNLNNTFSIHGYLKESVSEELSLPKSIPISYKAGDQPNNAFSLNVLEPGELATTAGTSGVVYGITDKPLYDKDSRVNTFVHVNHKKGSPRYGVLLCLNGTGILNRWIKQNIVDINKCQISYKDIDNNMANTIPIGSDGLIVLPYGNGAERTLNNKNLGCSMHNIDFNRHTRNHILRASQEGIVFALNYGIDIMKSMGMKIETVKAGNANMFLSPIFTETFSNITGTVIELYSTDGSEGAARGAGIGSNFYKNKKEAFNGLEKKKIIEPDLNKKDIYFEAYNNWKNIFKKIY
ncbi:MAG: FGGY family carbohydrate kinase [Clostridiales bacterium]